MSIPAERPTFPRTLQYMSDNMNSRFVREDVVAQDTALEAWKLPEPPPRKCYVCGRTDGVLLDGWTDPYHDECVTSGTMEDVD